MGCSISNRTRTKLQRPTWDGFRILMVSHPGKHCMHVSAIVLKHYTDEEILDQIDAAMPGAFVA